MFTGSCSYMWGAAWKKAQRCLCDNISNWVTELASLIAARSLESIPRGLLERMVQSNAVILEWLGAQQICITSATFRFNYIFIPTAATDCLAKCLRVANLFFLGKRHLLAPAFLGNEMRNFTADINNLFQGFPNFFLYTILPVGNNLLFAFSIHLCLWVLTFEYQKVWAST